jgi:hypothetical protein
MIEIIKAFDPDTNIEVSMDETQRIVFKTSLPRIRKDLEIKHNVKHVLFILKELYKEDNSTIS